MSGSHTITSFEGIRLFVMQSMNGRALTMAFKKFTPILPQACGRMYEITWESLHAPTRADVRFVLVYLWAWEDSAEGVVGITGFANYTCASVRPVRFLAGRFCLSILDECHIKKFVFSNSCYTP